jgi:uncharacterized protein (DUF885 family)
MDRRSFVRSSAAAAITALLGVPEAATPADAAEDAAQRALFDAFLNEELDERPEFATAWGLDTAARAGVRSQLNDYSAAGRARWVAARKSRLARLRRIDRSRLSPPARIDHDVVTWQYERAVEGGEKFVFGEGAAGFGYAPYSPYVVSQLTGPYQSVPDFLASNHPLRTAADAESYLARLEAFPGALDASTDAIRADAARGVLAPDFVLDTALAQLAKLRAAPPESNALAASLAQRAATAAIGGDWTHRAAAILATGVYPAVARQEAVVLQLRATATPEAGVWKLPDGEAYYAGALAFQTTTRRTPGDVHRLGREQVKELSARLDRLLRAEGLAAGSVTERVAELARRPGQLYPNTESGRAELLAALNAQVAGIRAQLPRAFATPLPAAPVEIVRVPPEIEDGAPNGYARPPSLDGSRPGRFYINLKDTADWPRFTLPTLTYHEALPGHQWQGSIARESADIPLLRRLTGGFAAYGEGWALYAEQLADELGMYDSDPLGRVGFVQSLLFRAVRLVVDTGIHDRRWSRERATGYMVEATALPRPRAEREIDRYCVWPGQACSYKIGHAEWVRLRAEARVRAGARFDLKAFHEVLRRGSMPLVVLQDVVRQGAAASVARAAGHVARDEPAFIARDRGLRG